MARPVDEKFRIFEWSMAQLALPDAHASPVVGYFIVAYEIVAAPPDSTWMASHVPGIGLGTRVTPVAAVPCTLIVPCTRIALPAATCTSAPSAMVSVTPEATVTSPVTLMAPVHVSSAESVPDLSAPVAPEPPPPEPAEPPPPVPPLPPLPGSYSVVTQPETTRRTPKDRAFRRMASAG